MKLVFYARFALRFFMCGLHVLHLHACVIKLHHLASHRFKVALGNLCFARVMRELISLARPRRSMRLCLPCVISLGVTSCE